jgi:hypothetical protein
MAVRRARGCVFAANRDSAKAFGYIASRIRAV